MPDPKSCEARQCSDQMSCARCGLTWDMNDPEPPECKPRQVTVNSHRPPAQPVVTGLCPKCCAAVRCEIELGSTTCWCFTVKRQDHETEWGDRCMCKRCLTGANEA